MKPAPNWVLISPKGEKYVALPESEYVRLLQQAPASVPYRQPEAGVYIGEARLSKGISQEELSEISGISQTQISKIESGKTRAPRRVTIDRLVEKIREYKK